jgi:peptidoglycan/xylan/chitin deacetylase (PgdA/CDA1 family)
MPWKERYTISDEKSLADDEIRWPKGARCCVGITVDLSVAAGPEGIRAADLTTPEAEFGANQGLAALLAVLKRNDLRATFAVPAVLAHIYAEQIRALVVQGHEIAAHGFKHEDVSALEREDEHARITRATEILAEAPASGRKAGSHYRGKATPSPAGRSARTRWIC